MCRKTGDSFSCDSRVRILHRWAWIFSQIGLTPIHPEGAYGNMSYRVGKDGFIVTKTGMIPEKTFEPSDFSYVELLDHRTEEVRYKGKFQPSSECVLHERLYRNYDSVKAILHGHSSLMIEEAASLSIPVTSKFYDYGTPELADSAVDLFSLENKIIILKDHGFVAGGESIEEAGRLVLEKYGELLSLLAHNNK